MGHFADHIKLSVSGLTQIPKFENSEPSFQKQKKNIFEAASNVSAIPININGRSIMCVYY